MITVQSKNPLHGEVLLPGDKSISHRAIMLGAIAEGETVVNNFLTGEDTLATVEIFRALGVKITALEEIRKRSTVKIQGVGSQGLRKPLEILNVGNSGTGIRLLLGILAGQKFECEITGDQSIQKRPMKRVTEPLRAMGAKFNSDLAPIRISPNKLKAITYELPIPSAQVKWAILFAGLYANGETKVIEPILSRDHSERMLAAFGAKIKQNGNEITIMPGELQGQSVTVPVDISSAAFFIVAGLIVPGSVITVPRVGVNITRTGILEVLEDMGADLTITNKRLIGNEPVADITARYSELNATNISGEILPRLIDEIPILAVAMSVAKGQSTISDAQELRVKESDRIKAIRSMLSSFGVKVTEKTDGLIIDGGDAIIKGSFDSMQDHRIAMAGTILGLVASGQTIVNSTDCINTSFPGFVEYLKKLGVKEINAARD